LQRRLCGNRGVVAGAWTLYRVKMKVILKGNDILLGLITVCRLTTLASITLPSKSPINRAYLTDRFDGEWTIPAEKVSMRKKKKKKNEKAHTYVHTTIIIRMRGAIALWRETRLEIGGNLNISPIKPRTLFYIGEDGVINRMQSTRFILTANYPRWSAFVAMLSE